MKKISCIKLGKIFDPTNFNLPNECHFFAQGPQALVFDKYIRIYFSTRSVDKKNGKFFSYIAYVDFDRSLKKIISVSDHTVIELGGLGCFDEHGIFPMNVLKHNNLIYGYTCGWNRKFSVSVDTSIGLAISKDFGNTFDRFDSGPILTSSLHEPCLVGDGFVKIFDDMFHMWYIFGTGWRTYQGTSEPDRVYKIGYANSEDGINWKKNDGCRIIKDKLGEYECQAMPSVIKISDTFHMFFCYREPNDFRQNSARSYRIGYAWSKDMSTWTRNDELLYLNNEVGDWDYEMQCYPHVFECDGIIFLLYNGNQFGKFGFGAAILNFNK